LSFLASLVRSPWAVTSEFRPIIAGVLARLLRGERLGAEGTEAVRQRRREWEARHSASSPALARDEKPYQTVKGTGAQRGDIAVVALHGLIVQRGGFDADTSEPLESAQGVAQAVRAAAADDLVGAIVLDVDSPGGSVYGIAELSDAIYAARQMKPTVAVANSLAASAAYWVASQAGELYCAPGGEVGSIGVYTLHLDISEALEKAGISPTLIAAGRYKTEGNSFEELGADARAHVQSAVDDYYSDFVKAVARGRNATQKSVREGMGQGRVLGADKAKAENMIDGTMTLYQVIGKMQQRLQGRESSRRATPPASAAHAARLRELFLLSQESMSSSAVSPARSQRELMAASVERTIDLEILREDSPEERARLERLYGRRA
jgi:signal peptide peptidase SppA